MAQGRNIQNNSPHLSTKSLGTGHISLIDSEQIWMHQKVMSFVLIKLPPELPLLCTLPSGTLNRSPSNNLAGLHSYFCFVPSLSVVFENFSLTASSRTPLGLEDRL